MSGKGASGKKKITPSSSKDFNNQDARSESGGKSTKDAEKNENNKTSRSSSSNPASPKSKKTDVDASPSQNRTQDSAQPVNYPNPESLVRESTGNGMLDRSLWIIMNLVGKVVEVQVKNGDIYEGIFHAANVGGVPGVQEKNFGIVLKMARKKEQKQDGKKAFSRPIDTFVVFPSDFVQLYAKDVGFDINSERDAFATDTEISGVYGNYKERELQRWVPDEEIPDDVDLSFNDRDRSGWDQFQINREKFGVETTWDERLYTTEINPEVRKKLFSEADRLAKEIEYGTKGNSNVHLLEERGQENDLDEEDRYGAVLREPTNAQQQGGSGKYIPPQRRIQMSQSDEKVKGDKKEDQNKQPAKDGEKKAPITKTESMEEFPPAESPGSPLVPLSPGETHPLVAERLRLRLHLVNEKLKNSAPVPDKQTPSHRSPLLSPLVGDAKSINALSLEPSTPTLPETVLKDFMDFSLAQQQKAKEQQQLQQQHQPQQPTQRAKAIADLKNFSAAIEKRVTVKGSSAPPSPRTSQKNSPQATSPVEEKSAEKQAPTKVTEPTKSTKPETAPTKEVKESVKEAPKAKEPAKEAKEPAKETKIEEKDKETTKSKLNPNAKAFKPMSATAPSFTPSMMAPVPVMVPTQEGWFAPQDPYMAMGPRQPVYPVPYGTPMMTPSPVMIPGPQMRVVPPLGYPVPVMPGYPAQPPMYPVPNPNQNPNVNQSQQGNQSQGQNGKRYPPSKNTNPVNTQPPYPNFVPQGQRGPVVIPQPFFPGQYPVPGQPFYPQMVDGQGKEIEPKFQGVPNTDNMQK